MRTAVLVLIGGFLASCGDLRGDGSYELNDSEHEYRLVISPGGKVAIQGPREKHIDGKLLASRLPHGDFAIALTNPSVTCAFTKQPKPVDNFVADCVEVLPVLWSLTASGTTPAK